MCAALVALTGCQSDKDTDGAVKTGTVIAKKYIPEETHSEQVPIYGVICSGNPSVCTPTIVSWYTSDRTEPECWQLKLNDSKGRIGPVCVSKEVYIRTNEGDLYNGG